MDEDEEEEASDDSGTSDSDGEMFEGDEDADLEHVSSAKVKEKLAKEVRHCVSFI